MNPPRRDRQPCLSPTLGPHAERNAVLARVQSSEFITARNEANRLGQPYKPLPGSSGQCLPNGPGVLASRE